MVGEGSEDEIDENQSQQEVSPRLKQIREKQRSFYDAAISAAEVIAKDTPGLIPKTIYNHY